MKILTNISLTILPTWESAISEILSSTNRENILLFIELTGMFSVVLNINSLVLLLCLVQKGVEKQAGCHSNLYCC